MAQASQGFLRITDRNNNLVKGECIDADHLEEIDLTAWNWGITDPAAKSKKETDTPATKQSANSTRSAGRSGSSGSRETGDNVEPAEFTFSKRTDRSSTRLISSMNSGEIFPSVLLVLEEEFELSPLPFRMELVFTKVFFNSLSLSVSAGKNGAEFDEDWKFTYETVQVRYLWRGKPAGWISVQFKRDPGAESGGSKRVPASANEQKDADQKRIDAAVADALKKAGKR